MLAEVKSKSPTLLQSSRALLQPFHPFSADIKPTWSVSEVRSALNQHERGHFDQSARLADAMGRDDRMVGVLRSRNAALLGADFEMQPPATFADDERAMNIAAATEADWWKMFPEDELSDFMRWRHMMGFALGQLVWKRTKDAWTPHLKVWHPQWVYVIEDSNEWHVTTREGDVIIEPGDGHWILMGPGQRPWMHGLIRALAIPWLIRQYALRDWARFSERHGMPIVKAMVPAMVKDDEQSDFFTNVRALATETTVLLPQNVDGEGRGFDMDIIEARDNGWESFKGLADQMSDIYAVTVLGNNLTAEIRVGSRAAASTAEGRFDELVKQDAEELSTATRGQALTWHTRLNFGDAELAPWPHWLVEPPEDLATHADALKKAGEALQAIQAAGYEIADPVEFGEKFGISVVKSETPATPPPTGSGQQMAPVSEEEDMADQEEEQQQMTVRLASGDDPTTAPGFLEGQLYADALADGAIPSGQRALRVDLKAVLDVIQTSTDYGDLRVRLREVFADMGPEAFARVMQKALVLSELNGDVAVLEDV